MSASDYGHIPQSGTRARWAHTRRHAEEWRLIGASEYVIRMLKFGIWDPPTVPFTKGKIFPSIPQSATDLEFGINELKEGCQKGIYQEISKDFALEQVREGAYVSSAFIDWKSGKGRFIINLKDQSRHWEKRSVVMETLPYFAGQLKKGDHLLSFDWKGGYRHFRLHPKMWNWFIFRYNQKYYRCTSLPFGWTRSPFWFCHLLSPLTRYMRSSLNCRVLQWIDDYLLAPGIGSKAISSQDCQELSEILNALFLKLGLLRHPEKGVWGKGATRLEHLGVIIDTEAFRFFISPKKLVKLQDLAKTILQTAAKSKRWVRENVLQEFTGRAISQLVPLPLARFFTRGLYDDLKQDNPRLGRYPQQKVRMSNGGLRDLKAWATMLQGDVRLIGGGKPYWNLHTDAADVGFGGTLGRDLRAGSPDEVEVNQVWSPFIRLKSITFRELRAVRLALESDLVKARLSKTPLQQRRLVLHVDNMVVFHIVNNMVSAKRELMDELRALHRVLQEMKVTLKAEWIPSAMNYHAVRLSRTWNTRDINATPFLMKSLQASLHLQRVHRYWPLGEAPMARRKVVRAQMKENWGDGKSRL